MNSRTRNKPPIFAAADLEAIILGFAKKAIVPKYVNEYTMMFCGRRDADRYGELVF